MTYDGFAALVFILFVFVCALALGLVIRIGVENRTQAQIDDDLHERIRRRYYE